MRARVTVTPPGGEAAVVERYTVSPLIADIIRAGNGPRGERVKALTFEMEDGGVIRYEPLSEEVIEGTVLESRIHA
jgi:hypothetical protein